MNPHLESPSENRSETLAVTEENLETSEISISRYRRVLYFVARRVLGNHKDAEAAVQSCLLSISRSTPSFKHEGSFRSWLVRVLIDETLTILRKNRIKSTMCLEVARESFAFSVPPKMGNSAA
jgi:RNA polymerase sigma factor (sigma-70 family)